MVYAGGFGVVGIITVMNICIIMRWLVINPVAYLKCPLIQQLK